MFSINVACLVLAIIYTIVWLKVCINIQINFKFILRVIANRYDENKRFCWASAAVSTSHTYTSHLHHHKLIWKSKYAGSVCIGPTFQIFIHIIIWWAEWEPRRMKHKKKKIIKCITHIMQLMFNLYSNWTHSNSTDGLKLKLKECMLKCMYCCYGLWFRGRKSELTISYIFWIA